MKALRLALLASVFGVSTALAQWQVPVDTVPAGRAPNVTGFRPTTVVIDTSNNLTVTGTIVARRTNVANVGGTVEIGVGTSKWQLITNQLAGGDLLFKNPAGQNVLVMPETGSCVGIAVGLTSCGSGFLLDVGPGTGIAGLRLNGATFTNNQGPEIAFAAAGGNLARIGNDCVLYGAAACNNDIVWRGPNSARVFAFHEWAAVRVITTTGLNPTQYVGGPLTVIADSVNAFAGGNGITAQVNVTTPGAFPSVLTALANVTSGPGTVWGLYAHCDVHVAVECAAVEGTLSNQAGAPGAMPASTVPNPTQPFPVALKATCGAAISPVAVGTNNCAAGVWVHYYNGNGGFPFTHGMYITEGAGATSGITVNATAALGPTDSIVTKNPGTGRALVVQTLGSGASSNHAIDLLNSGGTSVFSVQNDGKINVIQGGTLNSINSLTLADAIGFTLELKSLSSPALTGSKVLTFDVNDGNRTIDISGNLTLANNFTTTGNFALTFTQSGATTITWPSGTNTVGTAAFQNTGTSGATVPLLNAVPTWSGSNNYGTGTGGILNVLNGGNSANGDGAGISFQNAGSTILNIGNKSVLLGGAYSNSPWINYGISPGVIALGNTDRFYFYSSGGLALNTQNDPGAGQLYTNSATFMIRTKTSYTNGAGASTGTLTNAPAATNPTKWIPVDDNGTTRYVPAWKDDPYEESCDPCVLADLDFGLRRRLLAEDRRL